MNVGLHEEAVPPRVGAASEGLGFVVGAKISEDASAGGIGGANLNLAMKHTVELIEIHGLGDIGGDEGVIFAHFRDAIDLDSQYHGDAVFFELAGEFDGFRSAPAVAKNNDAGVLFFFGRELSIIVGVQQMEDGLVGVLAAVILKGLDKDGGGILFAQTVDEEDFSVDAIVVANEAAYETYYNYWRTGRSGCRSSGRL